MVLGVCLEVVNVDVGQAGQEQLKLLLIEDGNQPSTFTHVSKIQVLQRPILPPGDNVVESLQESSELFPDCSSHFHLTNQLDVISLVVISHLQVKLVTCYNIKTKRTYDDIAPISNEISRLCHSKLLDLS